MPSTRVFLPLIVEIEVSTASQAGLAPTSQDVLGALDHYGVDDPENPEEPIHIHLRALTSNEEGILHQSQLSQTDVQSLVSVFLEKTEKGEELETSDVTDIVAKKLADNNDDDTATERFYRRIQMAILKPRGTTIEWLKRRNPNMLDIMNDTIDELQAENALWLLQTETKEVESEQEE